MTSYFPRTIEKTISEASAFFKVVMVTGMRGVGKKKCLEHLDNDRQFVSLADDSTLGDVLKFPSRFFKRYPLPVTVEEVQRAPKLFLEVKAAVDPIERYGQVWLTSSQRFSLMRNVEESLAGRMIAFELMPLSLYERLGPGLEQSPYLPPVELPEAHLPVKSEDETWRTIWQGAFPEVIGVDELTRQRFYDQWLDDYLTQSVQREFGVARNQEYALFLRALASRTGQELHIGSLAAEVGVTESTVKDWVNIVEATGIIYLLAPYWDHTRKQLVKTPRLYFTDTGLVCHLLGLNTPAELMNDKHVDTIFKTFVVTELLKSWLHNGRMPDFYFYRDSQTNEAIDLLIQEGNTYYPIEINSVSEPT